MSKTVLHLIKGDKRTIEFAIWSKWLKKATHLVDRHLSVWQNDDPFAYNETASVAFLAAAGALAGHVTLAECVTRKLTSKDMDVTKVKRRKRHGRADLWLHTQQKHWAFEFKQRLNVGVSRSDGRLKSWMALAEECANDVIEKDDGYAVAGLILPLYFIKNDTIALQAAKEIEKFSHHRSAYCWRVTPPDERRPTYLLFNPR